MILTKFQLPSLKTVGDYLEHLPGHFRNYILRSAYPKKSGCGYPDIRIAQNIRTHEVSIHTKFQLPRSKMAPTVAKYPKKSENFKSGYPDIRIAQNIRTHEVIIHTKFQLPRLKTVACYSGYTRLPLLGLWEIYT